MYVHVLITNSYILSPSPPWEEKCGLLLHALPLATQNTVSIKLTELLVELFVIYTENCISDVVIE